jgi:hypothetical protein
MSDVVEIMARAMHAEYVNKRKGLTALWISHSEQYRESVRDEARAAIAALEAAGFWPSHNNTHGFSNRNGTLLDYVSPPI